jgi:hypothetical protein
VPTGFATVDVQKRLLVAVSHNEFTGGFELLGELHGWGDFTPLDMHNMSRGLDRLAEIGAIDRREQSLTDKGRKLVEQMSRHAAKV